MLGCQIDATGKAGSHLHARNKQMKDTRPFDVIRHKQWRAEPPEASPKLENKTEDRKSYKQHGGVFSRDFGPRGRITFP